METLMTNNTQKRIFELNQKIKSNTISSEEKDELMFLLYQNNSITQGQYEKYKSGKNTDDLIKAGFAIAAFIAIGYLIDRAFSSK